MSIAQSLLPEFDMEGAHTRKVLERVPAEHVAWRPHPKSYTLGDLALHIANLPVWTGLTLQRTELDIGTFVSPPRRFASTEALVAEFDKNHKEARGILAAATDADMMVMWTLKMNGESRFSAPRVGVLRTAVMNHIIHHRAQLGVYLRLKDVPLPAIYGPTADGM